MKSIIYSKISNERANRFKIRTDILMDDKGEKIVRKSPLTKEANDHIQNILNSYNLLSEMYKNSEIQINKCFMKNNYLEFEYLEGKTLEEELDELLYKKEYCKFVDKIKKVVYSLENNIGEKYFKLTDSFEKVFGEIKLPRGLKSSDVNNVDFIFSNIIIGEKLNVIDYEWTFDFPIPFNFIIYRAIYYYINGSKNRKDVTELGLFKLLNIKEDEIAQYEIMENNFQSYVLGDVVPINTLKMDSIEKSIDIKSMLNWLNNKSYINTVQVFFDYGDGFDEFNSYKINKKITDENKINFNIKVDSSVKKLRIDPANSMCVLKIDEILGDKGEFYKMDFDTNGKIISDNTVIYSTIDPQIILNKIEVGTKSITVSFEAQPISREIAIQISEYIKSTELEVNHLNNECINFINERDSIKAEKLLLLEKNKKNEAEKLLLLEESKKNEAEKLLLSEENEKMQNYRNLYLNQKTELENLNQSYNTIIDSTSWKITYPIRRTMDKFKSMKIKVKRVTFKGTLRLLKKTVVTLNRYGVKKTVYKVKDYLKKHHVPIVYKHDNVVSEISFKSMVKYIESIASANNVQIYHIDEILSYDIKSNAKNVLLFSHTLDLTGAPVAIRFFAKKLIVDGYNPIIIAPKGGTLVDVLIEDKIPTIVYEQLFNDAFIRNYAPLFKFAVVNTIVCAPIIKQLAGLDISVIWWIHEAEVSYHNSQIDNMPNTIPDNVRVYCGGSYAKEVLIKKCPNYKADILLYYVPDYSEIEKFKQFDIGNTSNKTIFASVGTLEERKGQDVLVDAIFYLGEKYIKDSYFLFIGKDCFEPILKKIKKLSKAYPDNVKYIPEVNPNDLKLVYNQIDCLICSSKDDPMPIVVTEAFLMKKIVICSENTGSAQFIEDGVNGFIYKNNDYIELSEKIKTVLENQNNREQIGIQARKIYDDNFSKNAFDSQIDNILQISEMEKNYLFEVSVVIPTYNAGNQFEEMINLLQQQKSLKVEIVVVDSGSTDDTKIICKKNNLKLIEIPNESFSHSYARNLGAENAQGNIIVFMTQDALPSSENWLSNLINPILSENIAAVSCSELCPEGTDLYYKICSYGHAKYVGFFDKDLVGDIKNCNDLDSLRKNASLNDVSCAIKKSIFMKYRYRYDYAEDLDLGIRLIKDGHKIKILSDVYVIHGHNRNADYYMKRAIVESKSFAKIFELAQQIEDENIISGRIVYSYNILLNSILKVKNDDLRFSDTKDFIKAISKILKSEIRSLKSDYNLDAQVEHENIEAAKLVIFLRERNRIIFHESVANMAIGVGIFLDNILSYLEVNPIEYDDQVRQDIYNCIIKNFSSSVGSEICKFSKDKELVSYIEKLSKGV